MDKQVSSSGEKNLCIHMKINSNGITVKNIVFLKFIFVVMYLQ